MSNDEEPAPSAGVSENEDDEACSDAEQASRTRKRCKTGLTKCEDEYAVSQRRQALSASPVGELMRLSQTTSTVFVVPCVFLVVKLFTTTLRLDQPMQLYDPARGDFDDADFPLEFGVPQATVNDSSLLKQGDVLLEEGVVDTRTLLARTMEERFLHNYAYKSRADERSWWCVLFSHPPQIQVYECTSLHFLLVLSRFISCVYLFCSVHSFSPKKK